MIVLWIGVGIWVALVVAVARDDARRERESPDLAAFYGRVKRRAAELKGRDA